MAEQTTGATALAAFIASNGFKNADAAKALGVSDPTIHDWLAGIKRPRGVYRKAIVIWTKGEVPEDAWDLDTDRRIVEAVRPFDEETGTEG